MGCATAVCVCVVFIPVCRKCVYIDEASQGTDTFQEVQHHFTKTKVLFHLKLKAYFFILKIFLKKTTKNKTYIT